VKIRPDGTVKVLDFGLAKALDDSPAGADRGNSPTLSLAATRMGVILGTAAYMSPEQAKGKPADRRSDIWAFGVVLYEMLTGRQLYSGENAAETLALVMTKDPGLDRLPAATPARIQALLERCLEKDPKRRLQAIGEARIILDSSEPEITAKTPRRQDESRFSLASWRLGGECVLALVLLALAVVHFRETPPTPRPVMRWTTALEPASAFPFPALSRDGALLAYSTAPGPIHLRRLDQLETKPLSGTDNGRLPAFSPDGQWLLYFAQGKLKKVPVTGGASITLCDVSGRPGAAWGPDDTIVFSGAAGDGGLSRVSANGGAPQVLTKPEKGERYHAWPQILPGGRAVVFAISASGSADDSRIAALDLRSGQRRILVESGTYPRYAPTGARSGHLVWARAGSVFAAPFDPGKLELIGPQVPVLEGVSMLPGAGFVQLAFSDAGAMVYVPGGAIEGGLELVWVDRKGTVEPIPAPRRDYGAMRLSPDGQKLAVFIATVASGRRSPGEPGDIWVYDLAQKTLNKLTFGGVNASPAWTPDGKRIAWRHEGPKGKGIFWAPADGSAPPEQIPGAPFGNPYTWTPDGKTLILVQGFDTATRNSDILTLPMEGDRKPRPFLATQAREMRARLSPDGRWLAYQSDETGLPQVYVQPFPGPGGKWQVSTDGGVEPNWARNGRELFYVSQGRTAQGRMMAVEVTTSPTFRAGTQKPLFEASASGFGPSVFEVSPDGQRFLTLRRPDGQAATGQLHVVMEWFEELKRRAPPGGGR